MPGDPETSRSERKDALFETEPKLTVETVGGVTRVRIDALVIASFDASDEATRRMTMVGLAEGGGFTANEIARAFGVDPSRLSQFRRRYAEGGAALLLARRGGKPGPQKLTESDIARIRAWRRAGKNLDEITALLNRKEERASRSTIGRLLKGFAAGKPARKAPEPTLFVGSRASEDTPLPPVADARPEGEGAPVAASEIAAPDSEAAAPAVEAPASQGDLGAEPERPTEAPDHAEAEAAPASLVGPAIEEPPVVRTCAVAGAVVAHVAIAALGLREALEASGARLKSARTFDLLRTAAVLIFGFFLRYRSVESLRMLIRDDFGALLGIGRAPEIRTIRRKLAEIGGEAAGFDGAAMVRSLARSLLRSAAAPDGVYFFDDHFKPYHGRRPLAKGWDAKRRLAAPGLEDVYVHDTRGRVILFVPLAAPTSLSKAMPLALKALREAGTAAPKLAVFDRGGWSRELFRSLVAPAGEGARVDFLTYLAERGKRRELPLESFQTVALEVEGRVRTYEIAETTLALRGFAEPLRVIVLLDRKKGRQIPILTSDKTTPAAQLVHLLRSRWRQENSFKYLVGELGIDALISRDMEMLADERATENPERAALREQLAEAEDELEAIERDLGRAIVQNEESVRPTVRGFKIANADLNHGRRHVLARIAALREDIARLPTKVRRAELEPGAVIARPKPRRRLFVNALKILAHNAEKWLADRMGPGPYGAHALPILRALFNQPGRIRFERGRVVAEVAPLDTPRYQACVERLFETLNREGATLLDSGRRVELKVLSSAGAGREGGSEAPCHVF